MPDQLIPMRDATKLSGYHPDTIRKLIRARKVKAQKFGEVWQISRLSLLAYLNDQAKRGEKRGRKPLI